MNKSLKTTILFSTLLVPAMTMNCKLVTEPFDNLALNVSPKSAIVRHAENLSGAMSAEFVDNKIKMKEKFISKIENNKKTIKTTKSINKGYNDKMLKNTTTDKSNYVRHL